MKILPHEVNPHRQLPDYEDLAETLEGARSAILEHGTEFIYDEDKFKAFIGYVDSQNWLTSAEIETCLNDLEKDAPQELLNLWIKTEGIATPAWLATFSFEVGSGEFDFIRNYVLASVIRSITSFYHSKGIVDHRYFTAGFEAIPHIGRIAPFIALAEEHPELARMLWAYKGCRKNFKPHKETQDDDKLRRKFDSARDSQILRFIIAPKEFLQETMLEWQVKSKTIQVAHAVGKAIGFN